MNHAGLFDASPNPYLVLDRRLHIAGANRAYLASVKRDLADIVGRWAWDAFPADPETVRLSVASFERVIRTGEPDTMALLRFDVPRPTAEGGGLEERYWSITHSPVFAADGAVEFVLQHPIDVTELHHLQGEMERAGLASSSIAPAQSGLLSRTRSVSESNLALKDESDRLNEMFAQAPSFMALLRGPEHRVVLANPGYMRLVGQRPILGRTLAEALPEAVEQGFVALLDRVYRTGEPYLADGARFAVEDTPREPARETFADFVFQPLRDAAGVVTGIFIQGVEVTARTRAEARRAALVRLTDAIRDNSDPVDLAYAASAILGEAIGVSRVGYGTVDQDAETLTVGRDWTAPGVESLAGTLRLRDYGSLIDVLKRGELFAVDDATTDPRASDGSDALVARSARSSVTMPVMEGGRLVAAFFVAYAEARDWSAEDLALIREFAERTRTAVERLRADATLRVNETRNRQILDSAVDYAIIATDLDGRVTRWNEGACRILGWDEGEVLGKSIGRIFTPEDRAANRPGEEMREALAAGRGIDERWHLRKSGERFWANGEVMPLHDEPGGVVGFVKVLRDRTLERLRDERLALVARASAGLLEAPDPDAVLGPLLEEAAQLLGFDQAYVYAVVSDARPDEPLLSLTHSVGVNEEARAALACVPLSGPLCGIVAETGRPLILSHLLATTEPRLAPGRAAGLDAYAGYPVFADGRVVAVIAFAVRARPAFEAEELDVFATLARFLSAVRQRLDREAGLERRIEARTAELREREAQLRQAQKMEGIGQLTGGLAHDVNNMLQGIGGALEMLEKRIDGGRLADAPRLIKAGREGVDRAAALTHGLLAFARRGHLDAQPVVAAEVVRGMADLVRRTVGPAIEVRLRTGDGHWVVSLDRNGLESALLNLALNARDAMAEGGHLTFSTREMSFTPAELGGDAALVAPGDFVRVSIADTGTGMPLDVLDRAFEPFFTTKPIGQGTGLGLSQIYGFVRQSGGFLRMSSEVGRGTTVHLHFPRSLALAAEAAEPAGFGSSAPATAGRTVLLVEDEPAVRVLAADMLRERGYAVLEAKDGPSGLAALAGAARVDLLVTDVGLPGLNGRQLAEAVRVRRPALPVLFITGYAGTALDEALPPGMAVIAKPFALDAFVEKVTAMLVPASA
jgi:PAS domain S-box-containing protein